MKILFQGDSITDVSRVRGCDDHVGLGYPFLIKSELGFTYPNKYEFINRGISGNRIVDLYARIKFDIINLEPDVLSILIGVNDVWHEINDHNGVDAEKFYKIYDMLIGEIKQSLPELKIMILEPFVLKARATEEHWDYFRCEVEKRAEMAKKIAEKYQATFIPLQEGFDALAKEAESSYWLSDGVHPSPMGHAFIKQEWLKAFLSV